MFASFRFAVVLFPLALTSFAQQPDASPANNRITLDVVVNDKSKVPVTGLQEQDFTILDNKQPQKILSFASSAADPDAEVILVIDAVNTSFSRVAMGRTQITKFLQMDGGKLSRPVSLAFFSDTGLNLQQPPSRDGNTLVAYLDQNETALRSIRRSSGFYGAADRAQLSLRTLAQLAETEAKRPGRKIVVWISPGWPLLSGPRMQLTKKDQQGIFNTIVATSTLLRESRVTLYAVDPAGTNDAGSFQTFYYESFVKGVKEPQNAQFGNLALQVLAVQSGGRVLNSSNDVAGEIERSVRDLNADYVLSFEPPPADGPNDYHSIEVKVNKPDVKAQTRTGYYDQPVRAQAQ